MWQSLLPWQAELAFREGEWRLHLAKGYRKQGHMSTAIAEANKAVRNYQDAIKSAPWESHYHAQLVKAFNQLADLVADADHKRAYLRHAMQSFEQARALDPQSPWFPAGLASLYEKQAALAASASERIALMKRAEEHILFAAELGQKNPLFAQNVAYFYQKLGHMSKAKRFYHQALALDALLEEANFNLGGIYQRENQPQQAIARFEMLYQHQPYFQRVDRVLARLYLQTGRVADATTIAQRSVEAFPSDPIPMELLASAYYQAGHYERSRQWWQKLSLRYPKNKQVRLAHIQTLWMSGKRDQAQAQLTAYLDEFPDDPAGMALRRQLLHP